PEYEDTQEARPFLHPQEALLNTLERLSSDDWQQKMKGLLNVRCLAVYHSDVLLPRLHDVSLAVIKEASNLRSTVSRFAVSILGNLFSTMKKRMDREVDGITRVLLQRTGDRSEFIQKIANQSLRIMVENVTPARAMTALMTNGVQHRNILVRKYAAEHLLTVIEQIGAEKLLSGMRDSTALLVPMLVKLAQDRHQDTRCCGRKMLNILMSHEKFVRYLKKFVPSHDLQDVMAIIKQKGVDLHKSESPPAKVTKKSRKNISRMPQGNLPSVGCLRYGSDVQSAWPHRTVRCTPSWTVEETQQVNRICSFLKAKEFQTRMKGLMLLLDNCKSKPQLISTNIVRICDDFIPKLQDCNRKVNQQALEVLVLMTSMLKSALHPVLFSLVPAVLENLNSKHLGISTAAVKVLEAFTAHLDDTLLLQALASRVQFLSGQALLEVTERLSVLVASVYPRRPQAVKHYALPVLWFLLGKNVLPIGSGNIKAVITKLAKSLYDMMGPELKNHATSQPLDVATNFFGILN
ncbi:Protein FAM179A, partial [Eurypyga helias]